MDSQILLFYRQYLQLFNTSFIAWPPRQLLKDIDVQTWIFAHCFDDSKMSRLPPPRYQLRVLKSLVSKIEQSIDDPDEDEISDDLVSHLVSLMAAELPSETTAAQQKTYVTFSCPLPGLNHDDGLFSEREITLLERPNLISGSLTTGFRTWEASMHLGTYLLLPETAELVRGSNVLELGVGTGFISILCANVLGAKHITATDGDEGVVDALGENLFLNDLDGEGKVISSVLRWGRGLRGTWVEEDCELHPYDVVLGADIVCIRERVQFLARCDGIFAAAKGLSKELDSFPNLRNDQRTTSPAQLQNQRGKTRAQSPRHKMK
nr:protein-lysine n-methyltransferase efm3 [Quercus suber]